MVGHLRTGKKMGNEATDKLENIGDIELLEEVGRGAYSVVYRGRRGSSSVAVKVLRELQTSSETLSAVNRFRREANIVARLAHPGIVNLLEIGEQDNKPFIVMEFVEGDDLGQYVDKHGPMQANQLVDIAMQLSRALREIHRYQLVHRDIKPGNIVFDHQTKTVKIIDFGLAETDQKIQEREEGRFVGTVLYVAPEQTGLVKRAVDARSDLYSLGATLFYCASGRPPFLDENAGEVIRLHASATAPKLSDVSDAVGPVITEIVSKLLSKDSDDRYQSAAGLLHDLENIAELERSRRAGQLKLGERDYRRIGVEIPFVGRRKEFASLSALKDLISEGQGSMAIIEGMAGSGKTRLAQELIGQARGRNTIILGTKCNRGETTPYGPLRDVIDFYLKDFFKRPQKEMEATQQKLINAVGEWGGLLKRLSPGLRNLFHDVPEFQAQDPENTQLRFYQALKNLVLGIARHDCEVILLIDDVQWLDEGTTSVLSEIAKDIHDVPMLILMTARNVAQDGEVLNELASSLDRGISLRISLEAMTDDEAVKLTKRHLGDRDLDRGLLDRLVRYSAGNPFAIGQYTRTLIESEALTLSDGVWRIVEENLKGLELTEDVLKLVVNRVDTLSPEAALVARVGALIGAQFDTELAGVVSGVTAEKQREVIEELIQNNLLEQSHGQVVTFVHDRVREAVAQQLSESDGRDFHQKIAEELESCDEASDSLVFSIARHYYLGHKDSHADKVIDASMTAGVLALENYANVVARTWLGRALERAKESEQDVKKYGSLHEWYGLACIRTGNVHEAYKHLELAADYKKPGADQARLYYYFALGLCSEGKEPQAWEKVREGLTELGEPYPDSPEAEGAAIGAALAEASTLQQTGEKFASAEEAEIGRRELLSDLYALGWFVSYFLGENNRVALLVARDRVNTHILGPSREAIRSLVWYSLLNALIMQTEEAMKHINIASQMAEQIADSESATYAKFLRVNVLDVIGDSVESNKLARSIESDVEKYLAAWERSQWVVVTGFQYVQRGLVREGIEFNLSQVPKLEEMQNIVYQSNTHGVLYSLFMLAGRNAEALKHREKQLVLSGMLPDNPFCNAYVHAHHIQVLLEQEDFGEELENNIEKLLSLEGEDFWRRYVFHLIGYVRLEQCEREAPEGREEALVALDTAIEQAEPRSLIPLHQCHLCVLKAAAARFRKNFDEALTLLQSGEEFARVADSPWVLYEAARERARVHRDAGDEKAMVQSAEAALKIAREQGYVVRARRIVRDFALGDSVVTEKRALKDSRKSVSGRVSSELSMSTVFQSRSNALLEVSLATASSLDPDEQARAALDVVVKELGAERGFLFLRKGQNVEFHAGRGGDGTDLPELTGYSSTVVQKVALSKKGLIVTGTEEGEALGSESAVAYDLRSIMAAPCLIRGELIGVVYVDSRLLKGLFNTDDLEFLEAISSHIALAIETTRMAKKEADRVAMGKDLALTAAVQKMFMPSSMDIIEEGLVDLKVFFRAASQSSGDWWWYDKVDGKPVIFLGDVSGHGAGSAMITVFALTLMRCADTLSSRNSTEEVLELLHTELVDVAQETMGIALLAVEIDSKKKVLRMLSCGSLPICIMDESGEVSLVSFPPASVLGYAKRDDMELFSVVEREYSAGERVLMFTDGLKEMPIEGRRYRELGMRRVVKIFEGTLGMTLEDARKYIVGEADKARGQVDVEDDLTFILLDL
jgi:serine phosphatase RsbU (regulator of sigma subunit)/predicted Ser/Thr protein kinase/tetratricopeptide (TPR) repeat protein